MKAYFSIALLGVLILHSCIPDSQVESLEGSWTCTETSIIFGEGLKGTSIFPVYFAQDAEDDNTYYIDNFYQLGDGVQVRIKVSGRSIILDKQTADGIEFQGTGTINSSYNMINLNYSADDKGGVVDQVQAEYSR